VPEGVDPAAGVQKWVAAVASYSAAEVVLQAAFPVPQPDSREILLVALEDPVPVDSVVLRHWADEPAACSVAVAFPVAFPVDLDP